VHLINGGYLNEWAHTASTIYPTVTTGNGSAFTIYGGYAAAPAQAPSSPPREEKSVMEWLDDEVSEICDMAFT